MTPPIESVWDYPRPPRLEPTTQHLRITHQGILLADTTQAFRVLETSHPPVFYLPRQDLAMQYLRPTIPRRPSFCEWKGIATYWTISLPEPASAIQEAAAWSYESPTKPFAAIQHHLAFYANRVDVCTVDGEQVQPQPGDFYGGWITSTITGPFKRRNEPDTKRLGTVL